MVPKATHFNWEHPKYIESIEIGNIKHRVPKGILFGIYTICVNIRYLKRF